MMGGVLSGILFVLATGVGWERLPSELGFGSEMTCWRRVRAWQEAGVWARLHELLLAELRAAGELDWSRTVVDASYIQAKRGPRLLPERQGYWPKRSAPVRVAAVRILVGGADGRNALEF